MQKLQIERDAEYLKIKIPETMRFPVRVYYGSNHSENIIGSHYLEFSEKGWQTFKDPVPGVRLYFKAFSDTDIFLGAERRLPLEHLYNCRDLGGYSTADGHLTKWGLVFRSDALHQLDSEEQKYIERLEIKRIIDFRSPQEIAKAPNQPISMSETVNFNPHADVAQQASTQSVSKKDEEKIAQLEEMVRTEAGKEQLRKNRNVMIEQMKQLVLGENAVKAYQQFFSTLVEDNAAPLIFHCQGGKDRTGWAAAIYLGALGVSKEQIYQDYLLTDKMNAPRNAKRMAIYKKYTDNEDVLAFLASLQLTKKDYLDGAYQAVEKNYGTMKEYLTLGLGVKESQLERLHKLYLY
jgi:protein-tyrosine phosphatase